MISGTKISQLPVATTFQDTDYVPVQRGSSTLRASGLTVTSAALCAVKQAFPINYGSNTFTLQSNNINFLTNNFSVTGNQVIEVNNNAPALRITQTGSGNAIEVEDSANPDATPFVVTSTGNVLIGTSTGDSSKLLIVDENNQGVQYEQYTAQAGASFRAQRARGTIASPTAVLSNDRLGAFFAGGYGTSQFSNQNGGISIHAAENFTNTSCGTYVVLRTVLTGTNPGNGGDERLRITHNGKVGIGTTLPNELLTVAGDISANTVYAYLSGNAETTTRWGTPRAIALSGGIFGNTLLDGSTDVTIFTTISAGVITNNNIAENAAISDGKLLTIATPGKVAPIAIDTSFSAPGQVLMSDGVVTVWQTLSSSDFGISDNTITTSKLVNGAVTEIKLAGDAVTTDKIGFEAVISTKLAPNSVTTTKILNNAVTLEKTDATPQALPSTLVSRDNSGNLSAIEVTANLRGNAQTATALQTPMTLTLSGDVAGTASFDGSQTTNITTVLTIPLTAEDINQPVWVNYQSNILENLSGTYIHGELDVGESGTITITQPISTLRPRQSFYTFLQQDNTVTTTITGVRNIFGEEITDYLTYNLLTGTSLTAVFTNIVPITGTATPLTSGNYTITFSETSPFSLAAFNVSLTSSTSQYVSGNVDIFYNEIIFPKPHNLEINHKIHLQFLNGVPLSGGTYTQLPSGLYTVIDIIDATSFELSSNTISQYVSGDVLMYRCPIVSSYGISNITYIETGNHILNFTAPFARPYDYGFTGSAAARPYPTNALPPLTGLYTASIERNVPYDYQDSNNLQIRTILNNGSLSYYDFDRNHIICFGDKLIT